MTPACHDWSWSIALLLLLLNALTSCSANAVDSARHRIAVLPEELAAASSSSSLPSTSTSPRHARGSTLAYLTPWNRAGFTYALAYPHKFTHLSPVWFQVKTRKVRSEKHEGRSSLRVEVHGEHDVDPVWLADVREKNAAVAIVPRFLVEFSPAHLLKLAREPKLQRALIKELMAVLARHRFDGLVLEVNELHAVVQRDAPEQRQVADDFLIAVGAALHAHSPPLSFTLVVRPAFERSPYYQHADFRYTAQHIDLLSLMTYDFSSSSTRPGPSAPLPWIRQSVRALLGDDASPEDRAKVLVGVAFYGMRWEKPGGRGEALVGKQWEELNAEGGVTEVWEEANGEMRQELGSRGVVYYPSARSVGLKVALANEEGCGLSIWEIGQGVDALYEQL